MKRTIKTLILGAGGQIGRELTNFFLQKYLSVTSCTKTQCDIRDESRVKEVINSDKFDFVINASAYTSVDDAESSIDLCESVNAYALKNICSSIKGKKT